MKILYTLDKSDKRKIYIHKRILYRPERNFLRVFFSLALFYLAYRRFSWGWKNVERTYFPIVMMLVALYILLKPLLKLLTKPEDFDSENVKLEIYNDILHVTIGRSTRMYKLLQSFKIQYFQNYMILNFKAKSVYVPKNKLSSQELEELKKFLVTKQEEYKAKKASSSVVNEDSPEA